MDFQKYNLNQRKLQFQIWPPGKMFFKYEEKLSVKSLRAVNFWDDIVSGSC